MNERDARIMGDNTYGKIDGQVNFEEGFINTLKSSDISYRAGNNKFNYRVCAVILHDGKILAMHHDGHSPHYSLPGGRVKIAETAEQAIVREIGEELSITARIIRPLWLNQSFFQEDADKLNYHELCLYFLVDSAGSGLPERGEKFTLYERGIRHDFEWLAFEQLKDEYFYPIFLKTEIYKLPTHFTLRTEFE